MNHNEILHHSLYSIVLRIYKMLFHSFKCNFLLLSFIFFIVIRANLYNSVLRYFYLKIFYSCDAVEETIQLF